MINIQIFSQVCHATHENQQQATTMMTKSYNEKKFNLGNNFIVLLQDGLASDVSSKLRYYSP